jgi:hypothetical protein
MEPTIFVVVSPRSIFVAKVAHIKKLLITKIMSLIVGLQVTFSMLCI